jgi:hypothetical protein
MSFAASSFDAVLSFWSLNHAVAARALIVETARLLRPSRLLLLVREDMPPVAESRDCRTAQESALVDIPLIGRLSILAEPTLLGVNRTIDISTSCPLAIRARASVVREDVSMPIRRARSGVITVVLAPVSSRNVAAWPSFRTTGTRNSG